MKKLLLFLKVTVTLIFIVFVKTNAEAESPLSFTQIPGTANALISDIMFDGSIIRVTGNYSKVNINGTDFTVDKYSEIANNTWQLPAISSPVRDGKFYKIDGSTYLVGNNLSGNGSVYKMQSGNWTLSKTTTGKILTSTSFGSTIVLGGEFNGYLAFYETKDNSLVASNIPTKPIVQIASTLTKTIYRYSEADQFSSEGYGVIDNATKQRASIGSPNDMSLIRGIGADIVNDRLYVSGQAVTSDKTYEFNGTWSEIAVHSSGDYFRNFWFNDGKIYANCGSSTVNGITIYGLAVYNNGTWSSTMSSGERYSVTNLIFQNGFMYINTGLDLVVARVSTPTGIKNNIAKSDIKLYPNPTVDKINITNPGDAREIPLLALNGEVIKSYNMQKNETITIDVSDLNSGVYFLDNTPFVKK